MKLSPTRLALTAASAAALILSLPQATAAAYVGGPTVMYTGSQGPVMGCAHKVGVSIRDRDVASATIWIDGAPYPVLPDYSVDAGPYGGYVSWTPTSLGWHALDVIYSPPGGPEEFGYLNIEVHRVGINAGSSCIANGVPLPIDPSTGTLARYL
ncbi:hypothetical protein [Nocardia crassostreae]|uniref:hypothetical protein n=1 Tax=Nocardia crassostreae TaxID=53428 RepID=UPI00082B7AD0|nr:hypothetical protein [Nocardia crassostreae]